MKTKVIKAVSLILAILITAVCIPFTVFADDEPFASLSGVYYEDEQVLAIALNIENSYGLNGVCARFIFDPEVLAFNSMIVSDELNIAASSVLPDEPSVLYYAAASMYYVESDSCTVAVFLFDVIGSCDSTSVSIIEGEDSYAEVDYPYEDGYFNEKYPISGSISGSVTYSALCGDANGDGRLTTNDVKAVLRHVAGLDILKGDNLTLADFNGDGRVTTNDAKKMLRVIAGLE